MCEHDNEYSVSIKRRAFLCQLSDSKFILLGFSSVIILYHNDVTNLMLVLLGNGVRRGRCVAHVGQLYVRSPCGANLSGTSLRDAID